MSGKPKGNRQPKPPPAPGQQTQMAARPPPPGQQTQTAARPAQQGPGIYRFRADEAVPSLELEIHRKEDALIKETSDKNIDGFPGRRGYGTEGRKIILRTNYFRIITKYEQVKSTGDALFRYDIDIQPEQSKPKRRQFIEQLVQDPKFNGVRWATDYGKLLVTTAKLDFDDPNEWKPTLTLAPPSGSGPQQGPLPGFVQEARQRNTATVKVAFQTSYTLHDLIDFLQSQSGAAQYPGHEHLLQLLNIVFYKPPQVSATVANVGGNKFYPFKGDALEQSSNLGGGLQALRGYFSSVRPSIGRLLLNVNVTSGAFYEPIHLCDLLTKFGGQSASDEMEVFIHHLKVKAEYVKDKQTQPFMTKTKTIIGFAKQPPDVKDKSGKAQKFTPEVPRFGNAHEVKFKYRDTSDPNAKERVVTVFQYFQSHHGITLKSPEWEVLNVGTRSDPQYLPPELCTVLPGQAYRKLLGGEQTSKMIKFAARAPNQNADSIAGNTAGPGNGLLLFSIAGDAAQAASIVPFGLKVGYHLLAVPARVLNPPKVTYGGENSPRVNSGSWNLQHIKFRRPGKFDTWQVFKIAVKRPNGGLTHPLNENPRGDMLAPNALIDRFATSMANYGIQMGQKKDTQTIKLEPLTIYNRAANDRILADAFAKAKVKGKKQVILIILPGPERWLYSRIKLYGDVKEGIHTVNAIGKNIQKPDKGMFFGNLALKFNIKGGGISHQVANTLQGPVGNNTIVFGIDVTHPSPGSSNKAPSIACVVANTDANLFNWPGSIRTQTARQEMVHVKEEERGMVSSLADMVGERLDLWRKYNQNRLPDKVVIYRDGVSEGQFRAVLKQELPGFQEAYKLRYGAPDKWPKTAIIICGKRHHTRFYPTKTEDADSRGSWNPLPGTVVDRGIVGRTIREFYLQAHQGLQGTAKPAHYSVIKDDIGFTADQLERFTLNLCYYFARCTKAVSVCPPAYYADLLAERGRAYLFTTLQESHGDDASDYDPRRAEWTGDVHQDIRESTWYI